MLSQGQIINIQGVIRMGKPVLTVERVYRACNKYQWFTGGTNSQYEKMFNKIENGVSLKEVALMIWLCTPDAVEGDIEIQLGNFCLEN